MLLVRVSWRILLIPFTGGKIECLLPATHSLWPKSDHLEAPTLMLALGGPLGSGNTRPCILQGQLGNAVGYCVSSPFIPALRKNERPNVDPNLPIVRWLHLLVAVSVPHFLRNWLHLYIT